MHIILFNLHGQNQSAKSSNGKREQQTITSNRMRRTRTRRSRSETTSPRRKPLVSFSENEMMSLGLFASASSSSSSSLSSSSSNLSPLAVPFTVERLNNANFKFGSKPISHFNFNFVDKSDGVALWSSSPNFQSSTATHGLLADSVRTATVPSTYSTSPNPISTSSTHNRSSVPTVYLSAIGPNQRVTDASFSSPCNTPSTHNWSSMNSSVKSGLEPTNIPASYLCGMDPNADPHKWSLGNGDSDAPVMTLNFNLLPHGSSPASYSQSLSGSKYSEQAKGLRGKEDCSMFGVFGHPVKRENSFGSSVIGKSHITSPSATCHHGLVSSGFSNEGTFTWNKYTSHSPCDTTSIFYDSSSDRISSSITKKSLDANITSLFKDYNLPVSHDTIKEKESYWSVYKSSLNPQVSDMNCTEEVNSAAHLSEHLDHHNPGEDSPCWKGVPSNFTSCGSQEQESSQHPMKKLQKNSGEDAQLRQSLHGTNENVANVKASESVDVNMVVKALNNLSELLVHLYIKDECGLKEQDHKDLDRVIANLNLCMSSKIQQMDLAQKYSLHKHVTSNVHHKERNNDQFDKNIEEPQGDSVRDEEFDNNDLPKHYSMVQKIKRALDENLECTEDLPSDPMLYKNLWLEAEAELCVSGYRTRLRRAKRHVGKSKALDLSEVASDIKKISSPSYSPSDPEVLHEAAGRKTLNTHAPNLSLPIVDDVENSVMARFNILKRREESNPVNMAVKESEDVEASCNKIQISGVVEEPHYHLQHLLDTDDGVVMHSHGNQKMLDPLPTEDVDHAVMARLNILKSRGELDHVNAEQRVSRDGGHARVSEEGVGKSTMHQLCRWPPAVHQYLAGNM